MEWLLIDKLGDYLYFKDILQISVYLDISKSKVNNIIQQSIKHSNKYTNSGYYIQRLFNITGRTPQNNLYKRNKYIYFVGYEFEGFPNCEGFIRNKI